MVGGTFGGSLIASLISRARCSGGECHAECDALRQFCGGTFGGSVGFFAVLWLRGVRRQGALV